MANLNFSGRLKKLSEPFVFVIKDVISKLIFTNGSLGEFEFLTLEDNSRFHMEASSTLKKDGVLVYLF